MFAFQQLSMPYGIPISLAKEYSVLYWHDTFVAMSRHYSNKWYINIIHLKIDKLSFIKMKTFAL